jgi:hypothetical protein
MAAPHHQPVNENDERAKRAALNQSHFREGNERIEELGSLDDARSAEQLWICECANNECVERIATSIGEYEAVHAHAAHFLVAPSREHVEPAAEEVVAPHSRYWVVEKVGIAAAIASSADPRLYSHDGGRASH